MKKRTLNQTWILCLRMWKHIAEIWDEEGLDVSRLKANWLVNNGFGEDDLFSDCFFCAYIRYIPGCYACPGRLVDPSFDCEAAEHHYCNKPRAFYHELLRLNRIRKASNKLSKK